MKSIEKFLGSNVGRALRGGLGIGLVYLAILGFSGVSRYVLLAIASLLFIGAVLDLCLVGLVTGNGIRSDRSRPKSLKSESTATTLMLIVVGVAAFGVLGYVIKDNFIFSTGAGIQKIDKVVESPESTDEAAIDGNTKSQNDMLVFLIEEEKLAHDAYTKMYEKYGSRVFANILGSEQTHQDRVLILLQARNINDPRSNELGKFNDSDLQSLYDQLISQGNQSLSDAYKIGVAIEEKDISDITKQLETATDDDIVLTLEALRSGSENHLRAFNRWLGQY